MEITEFRIRLLRAMESKDVTQTALAEVLGCAKSTVCSWCLGRAFPSVYFLPTICKTLGVSADYLVGLTER